ncbi:MAG: insulinase family protein [Nitrospinota bacterium]|nr:insulinase family protein [Nitrospinota bacterium]
MAKKMFEHTKTILDGKLRCLTIPVPTSRSLTLMILVRSGSRYETREDNGISHFMEHMFFKGAERYPDAMAVSSAIDGAGGNFNAFTSEEMVGYFVKISTAKKETAYDVLSDMLLNSKFDEDEIKRERGVIVEEIRMYHDDPMSQVNLDYHSLILGDQPLGWDIAGPEATVTSMTRDNFVKHHERFYYGSNSVITAAGGISPEEHEALCRKYFKFDKGGEPAKAEPFKKMDTDRIYLRNKETEQAHFIFGTYGCRAEHEDVAPFRVLNTILGGQMSSRLFYQIRERRGLAYYINSSLNMYEDVGLFQVSAGVNLDKVEEAIKCAMEEIRKIREEKVTPEELTRAKENIKGHTDLALEDTRRVATLYGMREILYNRIKTPEEIAEEIDAVTIEQVNAVAQKYFVDDQMKLSVIGPYKERNTFEKAFRFS